MGEDGGIVSDITGLIIMAMIGFVLICAMVCHVWAKMKWKKDRRS